MLTVLSLALAVAAVPDAGGGGVSSGAPAVADVVASAPGQAESPALCMVRTIAGFVSVTTHITVPADMAGQMGRIGYQAETCMHTPKRREVRSHYCTLADTLHGSLATRLEAGMGVSNRVLCDAAARLPE